jgi:type I restriction enzyme S subunit
MSKEPTRFKQTEIGELPEEWEVVRLEDVARVFSGSSAPQGREYFENGIFPFVRVQDLAHYGQTRCLTEVTDKVNERAVQEHHLVLARKGTILFPKSGAALEKNHRAILGVDAYIVSHLAAVEANPEKVDNEFLFWWLCCIDMASLNPNPGYPSIRLEEIKNLTIPLPPLEEQKRIAGVLRLVDRVAEETRRIVSIYERAKRFALKRLLTRGIGHTRFKQTEIGELPEEWEVVRLEDVARVFSGSSAPQGREYFENGIFPFVRVQDLAHYGQTRCLTEVTDKVNERAVQEHHLVLARKGTILFPKSGAALEKNHRAILGVDAYIVSHLAAVEANPEKVDNEFLFWWLCCIDMASLNPNPGYPSIRLEEIKNLTIPLPPLEEQKQIAEMLGTIDAAIENERRYLGVLEKCKRWLLDNLLTGRIRLSPEVDEILKGGAS